MAAKRASHPEEWPEGFSYRPDFLSEEEHSALLEHVRALPFQYFEFQGYQAKRRVVEYGWEYDFTSRRAEEAPPLPEWLHPLREKFAAWLQLEPADFVEGVVTEYPEGAPIGWHRDVPQFEVIAGVSLAAACRMRFKPYKAEGKVVSAILEPRSAYGMRGAARWKFQHSIPAVDALRYSITLRTLRGVGAVP